MYPVIWSYEKGMKKSLVRLSGLFTETGHLFRGLSGSACALDRRAAHITLPISSNYRYNNLRKLKLFGCESRMGAIVSRQHCHATSCQQQDENAVQPARKGKRKVALFVGYEVRVLDIE